MINIALGFLSFSFLIPSLLFVFSGSEGRPRQLYIVALLGIISFVGYLVSSGLWVVAMFLASHLILYYFGLSAIIAFKKNGTWLPSYINIAVLASMCFGWYLAINVIDISLDDQLLNIMIAEGVFTSIVILMSTYPVLSLLKPVIILSRAWPFISWALLSFVCIASGNWIGVALYLSFIILLAHGQIGRKKYK